MKKLYKLILFCFLTFSIFSCNSWMNSDDFFNDIDDEVFVANAERIKVYVRYAVTTQGTTEPSGSTVFKVGVTSDISCVTNTSYGFHHWAAFSTSFFDIQNQNKEIIYVSGEGGYDETILENELGPNIVSFGDKYSQSTTVKIHSKRNDIVLVPIVAERPTIERLSPTLSQSGIVRNTSLRYLFSKKMDLDTFNSENIKITSGYSVMGDQEVESKDITDHFIWKESNGTYSPVRSTNGKMITFRLKPGDALDSNQQITITISNAVKDVDGYEMESDQRIYFTTGTSIDRLAPIIQELKFGVGDKFTTYDSIAYNADEIYDSGNIKSLSDTVFDAHVGHRIKDKINVYLYALDLGGEGANVTVSETNTDEESVSAFYIRSRLLYDNTGATSDKSIDALQFAYAPSVNAIPTPTDDNMKGHGYAFTYDVSSLPDGLIAIDVWAMDNVGNSGLTENYYDKYDNGWRTILVVKDTTPPLPDLSQIEARSGGISLRWYNKDTLGSTTIAALSTIKDYGEERLSSDSNNLKWIFKVGNGTKPSSSDGNWKLIKDGVYPFASISAPAEGTVNIYMSLMDDLGNISTPVTIGDKVMYDNTVPVIGTMSWVDSTSGSAVSGVTTSPSITDRQLIIPFTEALSGIVKVELTGANISGSAVVRYGSATSSSVVKSINGNTITLTPPSGKDGFTSGNFYVEGISLPISTEGKATITALITDAAQNPYTTEQKAAAKKNVSIAYDNTNPELSKLEIAGINSIKLIDNSDWHFATNDVLRDGTTITLTMTEESSGIRTIDFSGGTIKPSPTNSTVKFNGTTLTKGTDYTIASDGNITFTELGKITSATENGIKIEITGCTFNKKTTISGSDSGKNTIGITVKDFAELDASINEATDASNKLYDTFYAIDIIPLTPKDFSLEDRQKTDGGTAETITAKAGYTNGKIVNGEIIIQASEEQVVKGISISGGTFSTSSGTITAKDSSGNIVTLTDVTQAADKITFNAITSDVTLSIKDITLNETETNVAHKEKPVTITAISPTNSISKGAETSIILDTVPPKTTGACSYSSKSNYYPKTVDTITPTYGELISDIPYFYISPETKSGTTDDTRLFDVINRITESTYNKIDDSDYFIKISQSKTTAVDIYNDSSAITEFNNAAKNQIKVSASPDIYSYIIYDAAGNCTDVEQFYLIKDDNKPLTTVTSGGDSLTKRMALVLPKDSLGNYKKNFHRNPDLANSTISYIMSQNDYDNNETYTVTVKLNNITTTDIYIDATNPTISSSVQYAEMRPSATDSGLSQYAVTTSKTSPSSGSSGWINYTPGDDISFIINSENETEYSAMYLHLKDNCGNTNYIAIRSPAQESINTLVNWKIDNQPPELVPAEKNSKTYNGGFFASSEITNPDTLSGTPDQGDVEGRAFWTDINRTTYFNSTNAIAITYKPELCLFEDSYSGTTEQSRYTVRAKLYFTENTTVTPNANTIADADPSESYASTWYYLRDKNEAGYSGRTFYVPTPHRAEGVVGKIYLLLEDTVGNKSVTQVQNFTTATDKAAAPLIPYFCYINTPPKIKTNVPETYYDANSTIPALNLFTTGSAGKYYDDGTKIYVNGTNTPALNLSVEKSSTLTVADDGFRLYHLYTTTDIDSSTKSELKNKINKDSDVTTFPVDLLNDTTAKPLYLYVRDVVVNSKKVKLGDTTYIKDSTPPTYSSSNTIWTGSATRLNSNNSYIKQDTNGKLNITIAGGATSSYDESADYSVYVPFTWFEDNGSGLCGLSCNENDYNFVASSESTKIKDESGTKYFILKIPAVSHNTTNGTYYVYDKVGNCTGYSFTSTVDKDAPKVGAKFSVSDSTHRIYSTNLYKSDRSVLLKDEDSFSTTNGYLSSIKEVYTKNINTSQAISDAKNLWTNADTVSLELETSDNGGISLVKIEKSTDNGLSFPIADVVSFENPDSSYKTWNFDGGTTSGTTKSSAIITLTATTTKTLYKISATDFAGNTMIHYVYLQLDKDSPTVSLSATPNSEARTKTTGVSGSETTTLYYKSLSLKAEISDVAGGIGLGAYKFASEDYTKTNPSGFNGKVYTTANTASEELTLIAQDKLGNGNSTTNKQWTLTGTSTKIDKFVYDEVAPTWANDSSEIGFARYGLVSGWGDWQDGTSDSNALISYSSTGPKKGTIYIKSSLPSDLVITPSATDTNGVEGYIITSIVPNGSNKPSAYTDSTKDYRQNFLVACSEWETNAFYSNATGVRAGGTWFSNGENQADIKFKAASGSSFTVYIYPVDYAGNVGDAIELTLQYQGENPVIGDITITPSTTGYYKKDGINYFRGTRDAATGELEDDTEVTITASVTVQNAADNPVTGFKIVKLNPTFNNGQEQQYIDVVNHSKTYGTSGYTDNTRTFSVKMPFGLATATSSYTYGSDDLYIIFYNAKGDSEAKKLSYTPSSGTASAKWALDNTPPAAPTTVTSSATSGFYLKSESAGRYKLYYKDASGTTNLTFNNADDSGTIKSGYKGVGTPTTDTISNPYTVTSLTDGKRTFYAYDNVLNASSGIEITYTKDITEPEFGTVAVSFGNSKFAHDAGIVDYVKTYYFNASDNISGTAKNVTSMEITFTATDGDSGLSTAISSSDLSSIDCTVPTDVTKAVSMVDTNKYKITLTTLKYDAAWTATIKVTDNVGNFKKYPIKFIPDATKPDAPKLSGIVDNDDNAVTTGIYPSNITTLASGKTVYINNSSAKKVTLSTTVATDKIYVWDTATDKMTGDPITSISIPTTPTTSAISVVTEDNVGNISDPFTFEIKTDNTEPTIGTVTVDVGNDNFSHDASSGSTHEYYFNAAPTTGTKNVTSINLTFPITETGSGLSSDITSTDFSSISCTVPTGSGISVTKSKVGDNYKITLTSLKYDDDWTATIKVTDNIGNPSSDYVITFKPDDTAPDAPTISGISLKDSENNAVTTTTYPSDITTLASGGTGYFKGDYTGTVSLSSTEETSGSKVEGIYKYVSGAITGDPITSIAIPTASAISIVTKDNVGNISEPFTFTIKADDTAPTPESVQATLVDMNSIPSGVPQKGLSSPSFSTSDWYTVYDNIYGPDYINVFYPASTTATFSVTDNMSTNFYYGFTYGNTTAAYTTEPSSWTEATPGSITVTLPNDGAPNSYLFVWFKDLVGNVSVPYVIPSAEGDTITWVGQYTANTTISASYNTTNGTITITGLSTANGVKSITLNAKTAATGYEPLDAYSQEEVTVGSETTTYIPGISFKCNANSKTSYNPTTVSVASDPETIDSVEYIKTITLNFDSKSYAATLGELTITTNGNTSAPATCPIASIEIEDVADNTVTYNFPAGGGSASRIGGKPFKPRLPIGGETDGGISEVASNIVQAVTNLFTGRIYEEPNTRSDTQEIAPVRESKKSAQKKSAKTSAKKTKKTSNSQKQIQDDILAQNSTTSHSEITSDSLSTLDENITEPVSKSHIENPLAENEIIGYNSNDELLTEGSSQAVKIIVAIVIAVLACISLGITLLLKRKQKK